MLLHGQSIVGNSRFLNSLALDLVGCMHSILSVSRFKVVKSYDFINKKKILYLKLKPIILMFLDRIPSNEDVVVIIELVYSMIFYPISPFMDARHGRMIELSFSLMLASVPC